MSQESAVVFCFAVVVLGGVAVVIAGLRYRAKEMELAHRERLAMIERGLTPAVTHDPAATRAVFRDTGMVLRDRPAPNARMMSIGVATIAFGLALGMIIGFAGDAPEVAVGLGGAIVFIGTAFVVNAMLAAGRGALPPRAMPPVPTSTDASRPFDSERPE